MIPISHRSTSIFDLLPPSPLGVKSSESLDEGDGLGNGKAPFGREDNGKQGERVDMVTYNSLTVDPVQGQSAFFFHHPSPIVELPEVLTRRYDVDAIT